MKALYSPLAYRKLQRCRLAFFPGTKRDVSCLVVYKIRYKYEEQSEQMKET